MSDKKNLTVPDHTEIIHQNIQTKTKPPMDLHKDFKIPPVFIFPHMLLKIVK